ncbi:hypothetical protein QZH41_002603 [Actinostola sp. cb2023]|nr:hypothetical protein QZH41_002603 [Actinostola sp. cb2023]
MIMQLAIYSYFKKDNGLHYHNSSVLCYLSEMNRAFSFNIVEYNNFEAGEGKSVLDTHFAHISNKIIRWNMTNVSCRKLIIDRARAPKKMGTFKEISHFGHFQFPLTGEFEGGVVAMSVAGSKSFKNSKKHFKDTGLVPRLHGLKGKKPHNTYPFEIVALIRRDFDRKLYEEQNNLLNSLVDVEFKTSRNRISYYIRDLSGLRKIKVCKKAFMKIFGIGKKRIAMLLRKAQPYSGDIEKDQRRFNRNAKTLELTLKTEVHYLHTNAIRVQS